MPEVDQTPSLDSILSDPILSGILQQPRRGKPSQLEPEIVEAIHPVLLEEASKKFPSAQLVAPETKWRVWRLIRNYIAGNAVGNLAAAGILGAGLQARHMGDDGFFASAPALAVLAKLGLSGGYWTTLAVRRMRAIKQLKNKLRQKIEDRLKDKYFQNLHSDPSMPIGKDPTLARLFSGFPPNTPISNIPRQIVKDRINETVEYGVGVAWNKLKNLVEEARRLGMKTESSDIYKGLLFGDIKNKILAPLTLAALHAGSNVAVVPAVEEYRRIYD